MSHRPFYHYGEGGITHSDDKPCEHGIGVHHPMIERTEWPNRRSYWRSVLRRWYFHREMRRMRPHNGAMTYRWSPFDAIAKRLLGHDPFPRMPTVWAPLRPEESIYPNAVEDAARWAERRAASQAERSER